MKKTIISILAAICCVSVASAEASTLSGSDGSGKQRLVLTTDASYGILPKPGYGSSSSAFALTFSIGANYYFLKSLYAGARIGYTYANSQSSFRIPGEYDYNTTSVTNNYIMIPVEAGYDLWILKNNLALTPYAGFDFGFNVKSKVEMKSGSEVGTQKVDADVFGVNARLGLRVKLWGFYVGAAYVFCLNDTYGDASGCPEVSIGYTF